MAFSADTDFHDAIIHYVNVNYISKEVLVRASAYENQDSKNRTIVDITFKDVTRFSSISNLDTILDNGVSGNVSYLSNGHGDSYFHLIGGIIEVTSKDMTISVAS